jgi:hypothetical protein
VDLDQPVTRRELIQSYQQLEHGIKILAYMTECVMERTGITVGDVREFVKKATGSGGSVAKIAIPHNSPILFTSEEGSDSTMLMGYAHTSDDTEGKNGKKDD